MSRRLDYTQIAPVGGKASHLSVRSRSDTIAALILEAGRLARTNFNDLHLARPGQRMSRAIFEFVITREPRLLTEHDVRLASSGRKAS